MAARSSVFYILVIAGLTRGLAAAESVEPLDAAAVVIELYDADVEVYSDPTARPILVAAPAGEETAEASLQREEGDGTLALRRPAGEDFRIKVEVVVGAEQELYLLGRELAVVTRESRRPGVTAPPGLRLSIESSKLNMEGGQDAVVDARESSVWLTGTRGLTSLTLESGSAELRAHQGDLQLEAIGAEVTLIDPQGKLEPILHGGSLDLRSGTGSFTGTATGAVVLSDGWHGRFVLEADGSTVEARGSDGPDRWRIEGEDLQVNLEELAGPVYVRLDGGRLEAGSMGGVMTVTATSSADVELTDLVQGAILELSAGATARLSGIARNLEAEVNDATLRAENVERLGLTGARSEVWAAGIERLTRLELSDPELDLDLAAIAHDPTLKLSGTGRAAVRLAAPCRVRIEGREALDGGRIEVTGCELRIPGQPLSSSRSHLIHGYNPPRTLTVAVDSGVELEVEGEP